MPYAKPPLPKFDPEKRILLAASPLASTLFVAFAVLVN